MLQVLETKPGLQFGSFLYRSDLFNQEALFKHWIQYFGPSFCFSPSQNPLAPYYAKEMGEGSPLKRFFVVTTSTFKRDDLLASKLLAIEWERSWSVEGKRTVNLDVGMMAAENFILATTKNYSHRVY